MGRLYTNPQQQKIPLCSSDSVPASAGMCLSAWAEPAQGSAPWATVRMATLRVRVVQKNQGGSSACFGLINNAFFLVFPGKKIISKTLLKEIIFQVEASILLLFLKYSFQAGDAIWFGNREPVKQWAEKLEFSKGSTAHQVLPVLRAAWAPAHSPAISAARADGAGDASALCQVVDFSLQQHQLLLFYPRFCYSCFSKL